MMLFEPRINFKGKACNLHQELLGFRVADNVGLLVKKIIPLPAAGIKINRLFGKCRIRRF